MKVADQFTKEHQERYGNRENRNEESEEIKQAPIVRLLNQIIEQAVHKRASDIHFEPMEEQLRIRFRVDGVLQEAMRHDITLFPALVARIKIVSGMDISEKRKPQDGRMSVIVDRQEFDLRVSNLPTVRHCRTQGQPRRALYHQGAGAHQEKSGNQAAKAP